MGRRLAQSVQTTLSDETGFDASTLDALVRIVAVLVLMTLDIRENDLLALAIDVSDSIRWTTADHSSERCRVQYFAFLLTGAHVR